MSGVEKIAFPVLLGVRLDLDTGTELDKMALFERKRKSAFVRDLLVDSVQRYRRNPTYKRFIRQLEEQRLKAQTPK